MKFFRGKESTRVKAIRGTRAMFVSPDIQEVHVEFVSEEGERLCLQLSINQTHTLINDLCNAYEAIVPPLSRGSRYSTWQGMDNN